MVCMRLSCSNNHLYNVSIVFKEQVGLCQHLLDWIVLTARLDHHSSYFIFLRSVGFSQIAGLFNR